MDSPAALYRPSRFLAGLDVGQVADPSALTVMEREMRLQHGQLEPFFFAGWLERLPLQTPYPAMVRQVRDRLDRIGDRCTLVIDATGVGRTIVDLFREGWTEVDPVTQERRVLPGKPTIIAVTLTAGEASRQERWDDIHVPKRDVIMSFMVALQQHRFQAAASLADMSTLLKEAQNFQWKVSPAGNDLYGAWREGQHDDLLLAVAIAVWYGQKYAPRTAPEQHQHYATAARNPLLRASGGRR